MSRQSMISPVNDWLVSQALGDSDIVEMFGQLCERLLGIGIPVSRARLVWPTLHPLFQAETVQWDRGEPVRFDQFEHQDTASEAWQRSPLKYLLDHQLEILRRELDGPNALLDFELMKELKQDGYTDYVLLGTRLDGISIYRREGDENSNRGILLSWATDNTGGFSEDDLWSLQKIQKRFAIACKSIIQSRISSNIARTYLGSRAGNHVLDGQIRRGDGARIEAVVWFSDLRNSTSLTETLPPEEYFELLNTYFAASAEPVTQHGGEILDFIGDAVLGIFPFEGENEMAKAAEAARKALDCALAKTAELNDQRLKNGFEKFNFGIGLNVGDVQFGNIGIPQRLSFSVIGRAVNQAARIETMTKMLQQPVLADNCFAKLQPDLWKSVGRHKLEGVLGDVELFSYNGIETATCN